MSMARSILLKLSLAAFLIFAAAPSQAQVASSFTGTVDYAGQMYFNNTLLTGATLTPVGGSATFYVFPQASANGMMATALTAMSSTKKITAQLDSNGALIGIWLNNL